MSGSCFPFGVISEDDSKFYWVCDLDYDLATAAEDKEKVCGPFTDIDQAVEAACRNDTGDGGPVTLGDGGKKVELAARRVKQGNFVKVYKQEDGFFWCGNSLESMGGKVTSRPATWFARKIARM